MRRIFAPVVIASALAAGGSALANDSSVTNREFVTASQLAFSSQRTALIATSRTPEDPSFVAGRPPAIAATSQGFAPVDTSIMSKGPNK